MLVVGLGHVGQPLAAALAEAGFTVYGVDKDPETVERIRANNSHVREAGLSELLASHLDRRLMVGTLESVVDVSIDATIISVESGYEKLTSTPDLTSLEKAATFVGSILSAGQLVIVRTTVPIGTTRAMTIPILESARGLEAGRDFGVAYCPERVVEGAALAELGGTPQVVGAVDECSGLSAEAIFSRIARRVVRVSSLEAAEAIKLIDNAYRDTRFAFANTIAELSERIGLNSWELIRAANLDYPRNSIPVPSPGVGGSCIPKDSGYLGHAASTVGISLPLISAARSVNEGGPRRIAQRLSDVLPLRAVSVFIAGFSFKGSPETDDMRDSPTLALLQELARHGARISGYDPAVTVERLAALGVTPVETLEAGLRACRVSIFMTNHQRFRSIGTPALIRLLPRGSVVVDGWSLFNADECRRSGLTYLGVGVGA
jgi:UDP-N-acetyl-D-mannosaminuronic acid dehydrogenase